ncbi:Polyketide cyclase / dehydrase and lipid transport [Seminavis robusta]|uniref:Polyketide cyclase / dehydrase and lipid transport n=1 Tax=Seminavis robusta TaxID=568900 RepID=A0A9N8H043_9STRA|nr:Polyketide cyclase / dehydrase and lipid transport [Seminavis robusta]|eukprot:Sro14_g010480.1 Polyketide cyclase / dehydrase and lipid transport (169) ;mRNA; f:61428-61934
MSSKHNISHTTEIAVPIDFVWKTLFDLQDWKQWNKWTLLATKDASATPAEGMPGILKACYEGNDKDWQTFDFVFGEILHGDDKKQQQPVRLLTWRGSVASGCLFSGHHTMRLERIDDTTTRLIHAEHFGGLLPTLGLGLPYKTLNRNYRLMNESFQAHVEQKFKEQEI